MKNIARLFLTLICVIAFTLPHDALARAGNGGSFGSRGGHTYQSVPNSNAAPIQRSYTQPTPTYSNPGLSNPGYNQGFGQPAIGHPFLSSLAGGLIGGGLASMLFGHSYGYGGYGGMGGGYGGMGGIGILPILFLAGLVWFVFRVFRNRAGGSSFPSLGPGPTGGFNNGIDAPFNTAPTLGGPSAGLPPQGAPLALTDNDTQSFAQLLKKIQLAWGTGDLNHLRQYTTPEMLQYFSEELSKNTSRGLVNHVENVSLEECRVLESWSEYDLDYATALMRWNAVDYMARLDRASSDPGYIESGDARNAGQAEEVWTFTRARSGGQWLLSAVQQAA